MYFEMIPTLSQLMHTNAVVAFPADTILSAFELFNTYSIRHIPIMDKNLQVQRVVTDTDLLEYLHKDPSFSTLQSPIDLLDDQEVITISPDTSIETAISIMGKQDISSLPIIKKKSLTGILTISDIIRSDLLWMEMIDQEMDLFESDFGLKMDNEIFITKYHSLWQVLDLLTKYRNLVVMEDNNTISGIVSSLTLIAELIELNRKVHLRNNLRNLDDYFHNTTIEQLMVPRIQIIKPPATIGNIREELLNSKSTAVLLGYKEKYYNIVGERDIFNYIHESIETKKKS